MKTCSKCQAELSAGELFCGDCGAEQPESPEAVAEYEKDFAIYAQDGVLEDWEEEELARRRDELGISLATHQRLLGQFQPLERALDVAFEVDISTMTQFVAGRMGTIRTRFLNLEGRPVRNVCIRHSVGGETAMRERLVRAVGPRGDEPLPPITLNLPAGQFTLETVVRVENAHSKAQYFRCEAVGVNVPEQAGAGPQNVSVHIDASAQRVGSWDGLSVGSSKPQASGSALTGRTWHRLGMRLIMTPDWHNWAIAHDAKFREYARRNGLDGESLAKANVEGKEPKPGPAKPGLLDVMRDIAAVAAEKSKVGMADPLLRKLRQEHHEAPNPEEPDVFAAVNNQAWTALKSHKPEEARALFERCEAGWAGKQDYRRLWPRFGIAICTLVGAGDPVPAEAMIRELTEVLGTDHERVRIAHDRLAQFLEGAPPRYISLMLRGRQDGLYVGSLDQDLMKHCARYLLAIRASMPDLEVVNILPRGAKIASWRDIGSLAGKPNQGTAIEATSHPPLEVLMKPGVIYFEIATGNDFWRNIISDRQIAVFLPKSYKPSQTTLGLLGIPGNLYHVEVNGQTLGPFPIPQLHQAVVNGQLMAHSLVWRVGDSKGWGPAWTHDELLPLFRTRT